MSDILKYDYPFIKNYLESNHYNWLLHNYTWIIGSGLLAAVGSMVYKSIKVIIRYYINIHTSKDLYPFYTSLEVKKATQYYIQTQYQNVSPSKGEEPIKKKSIAKQKLIKQYLSLLFDNDNTDERFHVVLADSGMGKTTFMINLYIRYKLKSFFTNHKYDIYLIPLGYEESINYIEKIKEPKKSILLLDGFDEDNAALDDYKSRLKIIIKKTKEFRTIIITCRTQFFPNEEEEPKETGIARFGVEKGVFEFQKVYISPFDKKDIEKYISQKYPFYFYFKRKKANKIIMKVPNLMFRPMLLSYIDDIILTKKPYKYSYQIYRFLIDKWIERECNRLHYVDKKKYKNDLLLFSETLAQKLYSQIEHRKDLTISNEEITAIAKMHSIHISELELKSKSLLNRNARGDYKFAHKSIFEYFIAKSIYEHSIKRDPYRIDSVNLAAFITNNLLQILSANEYESQFNLSNQIVVNQTAITLTNHCMRLISLWYSKNYQIFDQILFLIEQLEYNDDYQFKYDTKEQFLIDFTETVLNLINTLNTSIQNDDAIEMASSISHVLLNSTYEYLLYGQTLPKNIDSCKYFLKEMILSNAK